MKLIPLNGTPQQSKNRFLDDTIQSCQCRSKILQEPLQRIEGSARKDEDGTSSSIRVNTSMSDGQQTCEQRTRVL